MEQLGPLRDKSLVDTESQTRPADVNTDLRGKIGTLQTMSGFP